MEDKLTYYKLVEQLKEALEDRREEIEKNGDLIGEAENENIINEVVDNSVPIYNGDLVDVCRDNFDLMLVSPEMGVAEESTPLDLLRMNVYEALSAEAYKWLEELNDRLDNT